VKNLIAELILFRDEEKNLRKRWKISRYKPYVLGRDLHPYLKLLLTRGLIKREHPYLWEVSLVEK
jgi:hypothetical protein